MTYVIGEACVDVRDLSCVQVCPVDCISVGARKLFIHPSECFVCGACESVCPVEAITFSEDVEGDDEQYIGIAEEVFAPIGSPGGADDFGPVEDHPHVVALPPRVISKA
jgi:NAD-dependent dihydropyrimidine dehydrogenase PreA subunit